MNETYDTWNFPRAGIDLSMGFAKQPNRRMQDGSYARTTRQGVNVRTWEPATTRDRGSSRPGVQKYIPDQVSGEDWVAQELNLLATVNIAPEGRTVQNSQSGRVVYLVAVSQGLVFWALPGDTAWTASVNNTGEDPPLNETGVLYSTAHSQKMWFADGINYCVFDPATNGVNLWVATAGQLPQDSDGNYGRLICTWRGRIVLSGLLNDPQNWFMSAVGDPLNWDYGPLSVSSTQAVAGNNSSLGLIGDVVTTLIPYSDDLLIFGGDHTIYIMSGDPMDGGQIDLVSDSIGMAFGLPWCKDPYGTVYFFSNRCGIYTLVPGQSPIRISQSIEQLLFGVDTGTNGIRLLWNDRFQGLHVFITPLAAPSPTYHLFYEVRSGAWWLDKFASTGMDPLCCCIFDGNGPDDRVPLMGCWDGWVRALNPLATLDDTLPISSFVIIGPIVTQNLDEITLKDMQAVFGETSGEIQFEVFTGSTAEQALNQPAVFSGTWGPGRNLTQSIRLSGHAIYLKISSTDQWAMEQIRAHLATRGEVRMRGR